MMDEWRSDRMCVRHHLLNRITRPLSPSPPDPLSHAGARGRFGPPSPQVGDKRSAGGGLVGGWGRKMHHRVTPVDTAGSSVRPTAERDTRWSAPSMLV